MGRQRSPDRDKAFEIYKKHKGNIDLVEISKQLNLSDGTIRGWKNKDKWDDKLNGTLRNNTERSKNDKRPEDIQNRRKRSGNHNPKNQFSKRNKQAETHGFFSKFLPEDTLEVIHEIQERSQLDIIWDNIIIQYAAIIRAQRIMYVESKEEMIKELKKSKVKTKDRSTEKTSTNESEEEYEYEFQFAWDRQATFLNAQSRAMSELRSLIKQYDEMLHKNWDLATEEQKSRIAKLKGEISKIDKKDEPIQITIKRKEREE